MFSTASLAASYGRVQRSALAYHQVSVETGVATASPHQLISMLFDGFVAALAEASGAIRDGRIEAKCKALDKAQRIVDEGLRGGLDLKAGGSLAADLNDLYRYLQLRLTQANLRNDLAALEECRRIIEPLREAWRSIAPQTQSAATA